MSFNFNIIAGLSLALMIPATELLAADAATVSGLDEIVVTARKRSENLQEVPVSITAFDNDALRERGIRDLRDVANYTPNFTLESGPTARRNVPTLRGLGAPDLANENNNVGVFIDGVYVSARESINIAMLDIERVEVVRGPQSALYGRSTFAGAINYVTRRPSDEVYTEIEVSAGQYGESRILGILSGPLIGDSLSGRVALGHESDEGTYDNGSLPGGLGGYENQHVMGTLRYEPTDRLDFTLDGTWSDLLTNSAALGRYPNNCGTNPAPQGTVFYTCGEIPGADSTSELGLSADAYSMKGDQVRIALTINAEFEPLTFTSITAANRTDQDSLADLDRTQGGEQRWGHVFNTGGWFGIPGAPVEGCLGCFFDPTIVNDFRTPSGDPDGTWTELPTYFNENSNGQTKYLSQEFRLTSPDDQRLRWIGGVFGFMQNTRNQTGLSVDINPVLDMLPANYREGDFVFFEPFSGQWFRSDFTPMNVFVEGAQQNIVQVSEKDTLQLAAFGALDYDISDSWTVSGELRYTYEKRELTDVFDSFFGTGEPLNEKFKTTESFIDPRVNVNWQVTDTKMLYASAAKGSRSGDCNPGDLSSAFTPEQLEELKCYDSEYNWTYELGTRTDWFDDRLRFNLTFFYVDWSDLQFRTQIPELGNLSTITTNLGDLQSYGAETELEWLVTDGLTFSLGYGFSNPKFNDDKPLPDYGTSLLCSSGTISSDQCIDNPLSSTDPKQYVDIAGNQLRRTSRHTFNTGLAYVGNLGNAWEWYTRADYRYQSKQYQEMHNALWVPSASLINARLGVRDDSWDISLWGRNLSDENSPLSAYAFQTDLNDSDSATTVVNRERRRYGITVNFRY
jgi:iron complex outermembrane receptor protein